MSTQAIEVRREQQLEGWKSPAQVKARIQAIQQLMEQTLKKDVDYGVIPGMPKGTKPSLWKPGSEQILAMFQIAVEPVVEDLSTDDCFRYRVTTKLTHTVTGEFLGAGIGEASTDETKYKWRRTYSKPEFDNTPADRKRTKFGQRHDGSGWVNYEEMQVRQEPADLANTILKMAKKRAQIDATLTVTGASSMFEQDLEDLSDETREEMNRQRQPRSKKPPPPPVGNVICASCGQTNGHSADCKYAKPPVAKPQATVEAQSAPSQPQTTAKPDQPVKSEPYRKVIRIHRVTRGKTEVKGTPYFKIDGEADPQGALALVCWHRNKGAEIEEHGVSSMSSVLVVHETPGKNYWGEVDDIVELAGVAYQDGKPIVPPIQEVEEPW